MATAAQYVPVDVYLRSSFEPDAEYVDGEIQERAAGELDHAAWQAAIQKWFWRHEEEWGIRVLAELKVQVSPTRFRVPDVVVLENTGPLREMEQIRPVVFGAVALVAVAARRCGRDRARPTDRWHRGVQVRHGHAHDRTSAPGSGDETSIRPRSQGVFKDLFPGPNAQVEGNFEVDVGALSSYRRSQVSTQPRRQGDASEAAHQGRVSMMKPPVGGSWRGDYGTENSQP